MRGERIGKLRKRAPFVNTATARQLFFAAEEFTRCSCCLQ